MFVGVSSALAREINCRCPADRFEPASIRQNLFLTAPSHNVVCRLTPFVYAGFEPPLHACDMLFEPCVILHVLVGAQEQVIAPGIRLT